MILIAFSYVIGLPAVVALGVIAVKLDEPLIGIIGGPLIYGVSTLIFYYWYQAGREAISCSAEPLAGADYFGKNTRRRGEAPYPFPPEGSGS